MFKTCCVPVRLYVDSSYLEDMKYYQYLYWLYFYFKGNGKPTVNSVTDVCLSVSEEAQWRLYQQKPFLIWRSSVSQGSM